MAIDDKECFLQVPCDKLTKDEMKKKEDASYQPGEAIAFETEKTMFSYILKEFNVHTTGEGPQVPCVVDLENAFPEQFFIIHHADGILGSDSRIVIGQTGHGQEHVGHGTIRVQAVRHHQGRHQFG